MARDHARVHLDIWGDDAWRELSPAAQHLYLVLYTSPRLSFCGADDWRPGRIAARAKGWSLNSIAQAAAELVGGVFLVIDNATEEVLVRSWIKHDGLYRVQNMAVSMANAWAALNSRALRGVVVHEVRKLRESEPALKSWERDQVVKMLRQTAIDPIEYLIANPWVSHPASPKASSSASSNVTGDASPSGSHPPTPAHAQAISSNSEKRGAAKRGSRLAEDWIPSAATIAWAKANHPHVDAKREHEKFVNYWLAKDGSDATKLDWDRTWRNWIIRESESSSPKSRTNLTSRESEFVKAELMKDNPDPEILRRAGLDVPDDLSALPGGS